MGQDWLPRLVFEVLLVLLQLIEEVEWLFKNGTAKIIVFYLKIYSILISYSVYISLKGPAMSNTELMPSTISS